MNHKKLFKIICDRFDRMILLDPMETWDFDFQDDLADLIQARLAKTNARWERVRDGWHSHLRSMGAEVVKVGDLDISELAIGDHCYLSHEKIYLSDPSTMNVSDVNFIAMDSELALKILALGDLP